ncbi:MAG: hypothetical protein RL375_3494 [Pseudomonadota bacterium]
MPSHPKPAPASKAHPKPHEKPVKLEFNNSGAWKALGWFDAADDHQAGEVMDHAEALLKALHADIDPDTATPAQLKRVPTLRVAHAGTGEVLCHWCLADGWRNPLNGEPV